MRYRKLGRTGLTISEIGFGGWGIGGVTKNTVSYGPTDEQQARRAVQRAFDLGVNFFDTADLYGEGRSERIIGSVLKRVRRQAVIASKVTLVDLDGTRHISGEYIRTSLEGSLKRLDTDAVDLYQLFDPAKAGMDYLERDGDILKTLHALVKEGKVRALGISVRNPEEGVKAVCEFGFKSIQVNFNLLDQRALESGLFEVCTREGAGVIARTPLCFGFLTGAYAANSVFAEGDHRNQWPPEQRALWADAHALFRSAHGRREQTPGQFALRFCLSYPAVSAAIPGMLKEAHAEENTAASDLGPLADDERRSAEEIYRNHQFFLTKHVLAK